MLIKNKVYGLLGLTTKAGKLIFGTESCLDMINKKKAKLIIVAEDTADRTIDNFREKCKQNNIDFYIFGKKEEISKAIGKPNKTVIGVKDKNLARSYKKNIRWG